MTYEEEALNEIIDIIDNSWLTKEGRYEEIRHTVNQYRINRYKEMICGCRKPKS